MTCAGCLGNEAVGSLITTTKGFENVYFVLCLGCINRFQGEASLFNPEDFDVIT